MLGSLKFLAFLLVVLWVTSLVGGAHAASPSKAQAPDHASKKAAAKQSQKPATTQPVKAKAKKSRKNKKQTHDDRIVAVPAKKTTPVVAKPPSPKTIEPALPRLPPPHTERLARRYERRSVESVRYAPPCTDEPCEGTIIARGAQLYKFGFRGIGPDRAKALMAEPGVQLFPRTHPQWERKNADYLRFSSSTM